MVLNDVLWSPLYQDSCAARGRHAAGLQAAEVIVKAGGKVERLFGIDGLDHTALDTCELYVQENGHSVNRAIVTPACEDMGRIASAANFIPTRTTRRLSMSET